MVSIRSDCHQALFISLREDLETSDNRQKLPRKVKRPLLHVKTQEKDNLDNMPAVVGSHEIR